jgi:hypothetical protein
VPRIKTFYDVLPQQLYNEGKMDRTFLKRRYFELRAGITVISPAISASTLIGVAYLYIEDILPIYFFIPMFLTFMIIVATVIGFKFRGIQLQTDEDMKYEKQRELNKTLYLIMKSLDNHTPEFKERMEWVRKISENKL